MRYRIANDGKGFVASVEDGGEVLVSIPTVTKTEAQAIIRKAHREGWQAVVQPKKNGGK